MKIIIKCNILLISLLFSSQVFSETKSIMTSGPSVPRIDCTKLDIKRNESSSSYNMYANCLLNNKFDIFYSIYKRHLRKNHDDVGNIKLRVSVNEIGRVTNTEVLETSIRSKRVLTLIQARMKLIRLSTPASGNADFSYEFKFIEVNT